MRALCYTTTYGRLDLLPRCIAGFLRQTYNNKHLVIVNDDNEVEIQVDCPDITVVNLRKRTPTTWKRNYGVYNFQGDICFSWDDDDIFLPNRIQNQIHFHQLVDHDYVINESHLYAESNKFHLHTNIPIHSGSFKRERFIKNGGYRGDEISDDQWLFYNCMQSHYIYNDRDYIDFCYCWGGIGFHQSIANSPQDITNYARNQRKELGIVKGIPYQISPDYATYDKYLSKINNFLLENDLQINYL